MILERLKRQLEIDEGKVLTVYVDSLGNLTGGIGHKILPEDGLKEGDKITETQCADWLIDDIAIAIIDCKVIFTNWDDYNSEVQEVLVNMLFNLGRTNFLTFKKFILAVYQEDWMTASKEGLDSRWAKQVGKRAQRLMQRLRYVA